MKRLLFLTAILIQFGLQAKAQVPDVIRTPVTPSTGVSRNNRASSDANLYVPYSLRIPRASSFTLNGAKDSIGYIMFNTTTNRLGVYRGGGNWDTYVTSTDANNKVPYTGANSDLDLVTTGKGIYAEFAEIGHGSTTGAGLYGGFFYNESPSGNGLLVKGGDATHSNTDFMNLSNAITAQIFGDGHGIFSGSLTASSFIKNGATGSNILLANGSDIPQSTFLTPSSGVASFNSRTGAVIPLSGDYSSFYPSLTGSYSNPSWINSLAWEKVTGTPTTLGGYGIVDAVPSSRTLTINGTPFDLSQNRTWTITANTPNALSFGYGFTGQPFTFNGSSADTAKIDSTKVPTVYSANIQVADIPSLQSYTGSAIVITVKDVLRGGTFLYSTAANTADNGVVFSATGKGGGYWVRQFNGYVYPEWFGAKGDGTTNDIVALQAANDYATTNKKVWVLKSGVNYVIQSALYITTNFDGYNATITVPSSTVAKAIIVQNNKTANTSALLSFATIKLPTITNSTALTSGWTGQGTAVEVNNLYESTLYFNYVTGFNKGYSITSNSGVAGTSNNIFYVGRSMSNNYDMIIQPNNVSAYVNENIFIGGFLGYFSSNPSGSASLAILPNSTDNTSGPNANHFIGLDLEGDATPGVSPAYHIILGGSFNTFENCRYEFSNANGRIRYYNVAETITDNHFNGGYGFGSFDFSYAGSFGTDYNTFTDVGRSINKNPTYSTFGKVPSGGSTPYLRIYPSTKDLNTAALSDTDWGSQINGSGGLETKNPTFQTVASMKLDGGVLQANDGTNPITSGPFITYINGAIGTSSSILAAGTTGAWNAGHLKIGSNHIWDDGTGNFRYKSTTPSSSSDGFALNIGTPTSPLSYNQTTGILSIPVATTSANGYLSSTDWNTFNNKAPGSGSTNYIQNQNSAAQTGVKFWVGSTGQVDGGTFTLGNSTSNFLYYAANGLGTPTVTTRSAGTKVVLYPSLSGSLVDFAIGITGGQQWYSVPNSASGWYWYAGTSAVANLSGAGTMTANSFVTNSGLGANTSPTNFMTFNATTKVPETRTLSQVLTDIGGAPLASPSFTGTVTVPGLISTSTIGLQSYTVSTLPTAGTAGRIAYVTDATSPTYLGTLTGGGSTKTPVFDNGTAWVSY